MTLNLLNVPRGPQVSGARFDGTTTRLSRADPTGVADSTLATLSFWFRFNAVGANVVFFNVWNSATGFYGAEFVNATGLIQVYMGNGSAFSDGFIATGHTVVSSPLNVWHHCFWAGTMAGSGAGRAAAQIMYVDGIKQTMANTFSTGAGGSNVDFANATNTWDVGGTAQSGAAAKWINGDMAEVWFQDGVQLATADDRSVLNRFIDQRGKPMDMGSVGEKVRGVTPRVYLSANQTPGFLARNLTGNGDYTVTGTALAIPPGNKPSD